MGHPWVSEYIVTSHTAHEAMELDHAIVFVKIMQGHCSCQGCQLHICNSLKSSHKVGMLDI